MTSSLAQTFGARPLAVDLFCGLGGWSDALLAEGWNAIGFDIERHQYGEHRYPAQLVIQDVLTLHGSQFRNAQLIVASPPCQFFSYCAMPWSRAKALDAEVRADPARLEKELALFNACFRIQREACEAAGWHIPLIVENVRGAIPWVGRSRWNFGSFHLWGDVPALMPITFTGAMKVGVAHRPDGETNFHGHKLVGSGANVPGIGWTGFATNGGVSWRNRQDVKVPDVRFDGSGRSFQTASVNGVKGSVGYERDHPNALGWAKPGTSSHSPARKAASAMIAKIPQPLARHISRVFFPFQNRKAA